MATMQQNVARGSMDLAKGILASGRRGWGGGSMIGEASPPTLRVIFRLLKAISFSHKEQPKPEKGLLWGKAISLAVGVHKSHFHRNWSFSFKFYVFMAPSSGKMWISNYKLNSPAFCSFTLKNYSGLQVTFAWSICINIGDIVKNNLENVHIYVWE